MKTDFYNIESTWLQSLLKEVQQRIDNMNIDIKLICVLHIHVNSQKLVAGIIMKKMTYIYLECFNSK